MIKHYVDCLDLYSPEFNTDTVRSIIFFFHCMNYHAERGNCAYMNMYNVSY